MRVAVIPARGGSKRIPRKNIKPFLDKPIIHYSIEAAMASSKIDRVIVSTDDGEIAEVSRAAGAEVPFMRPADISDDDASTMDVIVHALEWAESQEEVEAICCLYATAPFVRSTDLDEASRVFDQSGASFVFSVAESPFPIQRAFELIDGTVKMFQPEYFTARSQDLVPAYYDAGQFYWCRPDAVFKDSKFYGPHSIGHVMERMRVQDIDTQEDWEFAEYLFGRVF